MPTSSVSNTSFVSVKVGHFYDNYTDTGVPSTTPWYYEAPCVAGSASCPAAFVGPRLTQNTPAVQIVDHDTTKQTYFQADYNASFSAAGFHTLKVGAGVRHNENDVDQRYPGGRVQVWWDSAVTSTVPGVGTNRGTYGYYAVDDLGTFGEASANIAHFYVQDQWSVGRLTLNLGLRLEDEKIPAFRERDVAIEFGWGDKIAPRIGAAYDMFGDGRMKLFGSYGRYYDWTKYELARGTFGGDIWMTYYRPLDDPSAIAQHQSQQHARPRSVGQRLRLPGSSCPELRHRPAGSGHEADESGQLQWRLRVPGCAHRCCWL